MNDFSEKTKFMDCILIYCGNLIISDDISGCLGKSGGLAQLARAPALQAGGQRFESVILHLKEHNDILEAD